MKRKRITIQFSNGADMWRKFEIQEALKEAYGNNVGTMLESIIWGQLMIYVSEDLDASDIIAVTDMMGLSKAREITHIDPIPLPKW